MKGATQFYLFTFYTVLFYFRNDGKKNDFEFCRRWEKQLAEKQKELESMLTS